MMKQMFMYFDYYKCNDAAAVQGTVQYVAVFKNTLKVNLNCGG